MAKHFKGADAPTNTVPVAHAAHARVSFDRASQAGAYVGKDARKGPRRKNSLLSTVLLAVGIVCIVVAAGMFIHAQMQYAAQAANNEKLAAYATVSDDTEVDTGPVVDWAGLKAINDDIVGWIQIPGTVVNYPVYQGEDNDEYLHTTAEGDYSLGGQIFMDYENAAPGMIDRQTIIYGHHLEDGSMFASVDDMCNQENFDAVGTVWYATENETFELEPLFIYKTPATNAEARQSVFASEEDFHAYLANLLQGASAQSSAAAEAVGKVTKVFALSTCDYENDYGRGNGRSLLICALKSEVSDTASNEESE